MKKYAGIILIVVSFIISAVFVNAARSRSLTGLENVLFQAISLCFGIGGSYILGRESTIDAAKELIKPHAKSAFRRLLSLYYGLSRLIQAIQKIKVETNSEQIHKSALDILEVMATDQIYTADDALNDWSDIVPEDVEQLLQKNNNTQKSESKK